MPRVVVLTSGEHGSPIDYTEALVAALDDPDVVEIRQIEDDRLRRIRRRDPTAPGGWVVVNPDASPES